MRCKDCGKFKPDVRTEAGAELSPNIKSMGGKCNINDKKCGAMDSCGCGGFEKK